MAFKYGIHIEHNSLRLFHVLQYYWTRMFVLSNLFLEEKNYKFYDTIYCVYTNLACIVLNIFHFISHNVIFVHKQIQ